MDYNNPIEVPVEILKFYSAFYKFVWPDDNGLGPVKKYEIDKAVKKQNFEIYKDHYHPDYATRQYHIKRIILFCYKYRP